MCLTTAASRVTVIHEPQHRAHAARGGSIKNFADFEDCRGYICTAPQLQDLAPHPCWKTGKCTGLEAADSLVKNVESFYRRN